MDIPLGVFALFAMASMGLFFASVFARERYIPMFALGAGAIWFAQMVFIQNVIIDYQEPRILNITTIAGNMHYIYNQTQQPDVWNFQNTQTNVYFTAIGAFMMVIGALEFRVNKSA